MSIKLKYKCLLAIGYQLLAISYTNAQQRGVDTIEVNVITSYKPVISDAAKINGNPVIADTARMVKNVTYTLLNSQYPTSYAPQSIGAMTLKPEPPEPLQQSLLSAGAGNYNTLYAEYFFNCLRSANADYGIHLNHLSSEATLDNYGFSGYSFNDVNLWGKETFGQHSLYAEADIDSHVLHDYGYNTSEFNLNDYATRESLNSLGGMLKYKSEYKDSTKFNHEIKIDYDNFSDIYNSVENNANLNVNLFTYLDHQRFDINGMVQYYNDVSAIYNNTNWNTMLNPFFTINETRWDAHIGINAYYANVTGGANVFPDVSARLHIAQDVVMLYAGWDGSQTFNSYKSLSEQNPYVQNILDMQFTFVENHVYGGLTGTITSQLTYNASMAVSQINNMPLFITDTLEGYSNMFMVIYDNVMETNIHGDLDYKWDNAFSMAIGGDYFIYKPSTQLEVWYHPGLKLWLDGKYIINDKYDVRAEFFVIGSQYAPQLVDTVIHAKTLSGYPDLNLGLDYHFKQTFSAFVNLNNLANITYYQWENYPMQRFNIMVGVRIGF